MPKPSVLVLYNQPQLAWDHPDAESEHTVVGVAEFMARTLEAEGMNASLLGLGADPVKLWRELKRRRIDVVFNLFEGNHHHPETESYVAGLLAWSGVPFTGSPFSALSLARAKHTTKLVLRSAGLPTAKSQIVHTLPAPAWTDAYPVIVKPALQDASVGIDHHSVCTNRRQLLRRIEHVHATYGPPALVEEYIPGREFNVAVLELPELKTLRPRELRLPAEKPGQWSIYTYAGKWVVGSPDSEQTRLEFPTDLSAAAVRNLHRLAVQAYRLIGCRDYARVDFRMKANGTAYILEINPNPDISEDADLTACLGSVQMTHPEFIVRLVQQALSRKHV